MESLLQVLSASLAIHNLPLTAMLAVVVVYWLLAAVGLLDSHIGEGGGGDLHGHHDGMDVDTPHGVVPSLMSFLNAGHVPVMVVVSFLVLALWAIGILSNHYLNPQGSWLLALGLFVPNLIGSVFLTRLLVLPLRPAFAALNKDYDQAKPIVGQLCLVTTSQVTETFGQATIETRGAPITINVRLTGGEPLTRGDQALVIEEDRDKQIYRVVKYEQPKLES